jgi:alpha-amylase
VSNLSQLKDTPTPAKFDYPWRVRFLLVSLLFFMSSTCVFGAATNPRAPGLIYEIFTRSFGDLATIQSRLDYIQSLGADTIWLTPIFKSPSYHGYDVEDYMSIQPDFGDLAALQSLVKAVHQRGMRLLLDLPVNHTSIQHPWFSANSDLYLWSPTPLDWPKITLRKNDTPEAHWHLFDSVYYFSTFSWDMPDLNWHNPEVLSRIENVFQFWTSQGVDGFRLDAAKYLIKGPEGEQNMPETHQIWKEIVASVRAQKPDAYFVGEVWDTAANIAPYYGNGDELDAAFDFPVTGAIRSSLTNGTSTAFASALSNQLTTELNSYFAAPFVGNHDMDRLATVLKGDTASEKLAALAMMTLPGTPVIYYGDEIGMQNSQASGDLAKRAPMDWARVAAQEIDPASLLNTYKSLSQLRKSSQALSEGTLSDIQQLGSSGVSYLRTSGDSTVLVILNFGNQTLPAQVISLGGSQIQVGPTGPRQGTVMDVGTERVPNSLRRQSQRLSNPAF